METLNTSIIVLLILNLIGVAYSYGALNQKVKTLGKNLDDMTKRIDRMENTHFK